MLSSQFRAPETQHPPITQPEPSFPAKANDDLHLPAIAVDQHSLHQLLQTKPVIPQLNLGQLLTAFGVITQEDLQHALALKLTHPDHHLGQLVIEYCHSDEVLVARTLAYHLGLPFVSLKHFDVDARLLTQIPREIANKYKIMPLYMDGYRLLVATDNPTNAEGLHMIEFLSKKTVETCVSSSKDLFNAIEQHYGKQDNIDVYHELEPGNNADHLELADIREAEELSKQRPIVRLVSNLLTEALRNQASDIHIRPGEHSVDILFRIDSNLVKIRHYNKAIHAAVVSRIKILGQMDISERRVPQDGRSKLTYQDKSVDLRISVMPTINGESIVIRLLDTSKGLRSLEDIGFNAHELHLLKSMLDRSYGIVLVTGPTGSGKSTTLYAGLQHIKNNNVNIITAEDPVEYRMAGIEQMQVNHKIGYSFSRILRNILRHDPDVIMVGEMRDQETAKIAIESALTGHLVLSTLHTNSAAVAITRLMEMGIESYLIHDSVLGVLAQRLVRLNCPHCTEIEEVPDYVYDALNVNHDEQFYRGCGCEACHGTGFQGRMAVYELLPMTPVVRHAIKPGVSAEEIETIAINHGMTPLTQNALNTAREGKIALAEVYRIRLA